jgi:hypothetical protein
MVRDTDFGPKWEQHDYERMKQALEPLKAEFGGPASGHGSVENPKFDVILDTPIKSGWIEAVVENIHSELNDEGFMIKSSEITCDYNGATNPAVVLRVECYPDVYR